MTRLGLGVAFDESLESSKLLITLTRAEDRRFDQLPKQTETSGPMRFDLEL